MYVFGKYGILKDPTSIYAVESDKGLYEIHAENEKEIVLLYENIAEGAIEQKMHSMYISLVMQEQEL